MFQLLVAQFFAFTKWLLFLRIMHCNTTSLSLWVKGPLETRMVLAAFWRFSRIKKEKNSLGLNARSHKFRKTKKQKTPQDKTLPYTSQQLCRHTIHQGSQLKSLCWHIWRPSPQPRNCNLKKMHSSGILQTSCIHSKEIWLQKTSISQGKSVQLKAHQFLLMSSLASWYSLLGLSGGGQHSTVPFSWGKALAGPVKGNLPQSQLLKTHLHSQSDFANLSWLTQHNHPVLPLH